MRRYASAAAFADDLRRHLAGKPIAASPASTSYLIWRQVLKRKGLIGASYLGILGVLLACAVLLPRIFTERKQRIAMGELSTGTRWLLYLLIVSMLYLGVIPDPLMSFLRSIL